MTKSVGSSRLKSVGVLGGGVRFAGVKRRWLAVAVLVSLMGGGLSWSSAVAQTPTPTPTPTVMFTPCTPKMAAPSKPTGLTATVNPDDKPDEDWILESGILLQWTAADASESVFSYDLFRREKVEGTTLAYHASTTLVSTYYSETDEYVTPSEPIMDIMDPADFENLKDGTTYEYAVKALQVNDCDAIAESPLSDPVSATYTAPTEVEDDQVGGL